MEQHAERRLKEEEDRLEEEREREEELSKRKSSGDSVSKNPSSTSTPVKRKITPQQRQIGLKQKRRQRAENTKQLPGGGRVSEAYAFTGMHHIWDEHHEAGKFSRCFGLTTSIGRSSSNSPLTFCLQ